MNQQEFDKRIADKLAQQTFAPNEQSWLALQSQITTNPPVINIDETPIAKTPFKWVRVAAILLPLIAIWGIYKYTSTPKINVVAEKNTQNNLQPAIASTTPNTSTNDTDIINTPILATNKTIGEKAVVAYLKSHPTTAINFVNKNTNSSAQQTNISPNKTISIQSPKPQQTIEQLAETINTIAVKNKEENKITESPNQINTENILPEKPKQTIANQNLALDLSTPNHTKPIDKRMHINVLAGMQTNTQTSFSNAINIGLGTQKNITKKIYVDASISISSNNPSWLQSRIVSPTELRSSIASLNNGNIIESKSGDNNIVNAYGVNISNNTFSANGNTIPISELTDDVNIATAAAYRLASNQIEFAPMIGYKLSNRFKVAGGVDAAKIITTNSYQKSVDLLLLQSQVAPTVRSWDMGALAKVEYAISKKIVVGYRYRQGLTNITNSIATRRSYNGVLVKYQFK